MICMNFMNTDTAEGTKMGSIANPTRAFCKHEGGTVAVISAVAMVVLLSAIGIAIDYGRATYVQTRMQTALDTAVLAAAALDLSKQGATATSTFNTNFKMADAGTVSLTFGNDATGFTGTARTDVKTTLASVLGVRQLPVTVRSSAKLGSGGSSGAVCILVLDPTASQALLVNGGASVTAPNCEVHVKSTGPNAAVFNAATTLDTAKICIEGTSILDNGGTHPNTQTGCSTAIDPFAGTLPSPVTTGCDYTALNFNGGTVNLQPGVYCGGINFNSAPNVTFAPGVYVVKGGDWNVNGGTWSGSEVTFFFADSSRIQFNSGVASSLTAPTSGTYSGIFMFEADGLAHSPFVLDDSKGFKVSGLIYLPSRDMIFNYGSSITSKTMTLVANTLILDQTKWNLDTSSREIPASATAGVAVLTK